MIEQFRLTYEFSPIILVGGSAQNMSGGMLPIISLMGSNDFQQGILGGADIDEDTIARFSPLAGSTLEEISVGTYPFANQYVAANAIIFEPLKISLLMLAPAPTKGGYFAKQNAFTTMKSALDQHMRNGGTFNINTPAYLYQACLLTALRDITPPDQRQVQMTWQWDFFQPLLTMQQAQGAQNSLVSKISAGTQVQGDPPQQGGLLSTTGQTTPGISSSLVPSLTPLGGASASASPGGVASSSSGASSPIAGPSGPPGPPI